MALGMNPRKKGLFGKPFEVPGTPGIGDGMDQVPTGVDPAPGLGMRGEAPAPTMGLGSRLFGRGWEDKAFALGGIMRGDPSGVYMMQQQKAQEQNALAQQAAEMRKRSLDLADKKWEIDYRAQNEGPKTYEDNAGNRWAYDPKTGQTIGDKPLWVDPTPKEFVHEGMRFSIRNPYAQGGGGSGLPTVSDKASYDSVPVGGQYRDAQGNIRTKSGGPSQPATGGF